MADFRGGRGKRVGYETQMYRIPSPLRPIVESLGLQFRQLWDGVSDPDGTKLISRIERAIPDVEQLATSNGGNQISGKGETAISDIKYKDAEAEEEAEPDEPDQSDEQTIRDQAAKNFNLLTENRMLERELSEVRSQLASASEILKEALTLKPNAGGAIKRKIEKALELMGIDSEED